MQTPKCLSDLVYFENVHPVDVASVGIQFEADRVFNEQLPDLLPDKPVIVRFLFSEVNSEGVRVRVYEAYKDPVGWYRNDQPAD